MVIMIRTAIIKRGITAPIEVDVICDGRPMASIRCLDYEVEGTMIICNHGEYNSYAHVDDYIVTTWRYRYAT